MVSELREDLQNLLDDIIIGINNSKTTSELENIRINCLGKKGSITLYLKNIRDYDIEIKKEIGSYLNDIKNQINKLILDKKNFFKKENLMKLNYKVGKPILLDLLNLKILVSNKNQKLLEDTFRIVLKQNVPIFPIKAENLMKNYKLKEGKFLGTKLDEIEQYWIENNFKISNEEIKRLIHN